MFRRFVPTIGAWLVLELFAPAFCIAQQEPIANPQEFSREGVYVGGGFGIGFEQYDGGPGRPDYNPGLAVDGFLGYRFDSLFALEAYIEYVDFIDTNDTSPNTDTSLMSFGGNFKFYLRPQRFQAYLLTGIGMTRVEVEQGSADKDDTDLSVRLGTGFDYYLTRNIALGGVFNYVIATGDVSNFDHATLKFVAMYRF